MPESDIEKIALGLQKAEQLLVQMCHVHSALLNLVVTRCNLDPKDVRNLLSAVERRHEQIRSLRAGHKEWLKNDNSPELLLCGCDHPTMLASGPSRRRRNTAR